MISNLFAPLAMKIAGGLALGAFVALGVVMWRADAISAQRDALQTKLAGEEARHAVTRQSVDVLETALARFVGDGKARRVSQLAAVEAQQARSEAMRNYAARIRAEMADFAADDPCDCSTPDFVMEGR